MGKEKRLSVDLDTETHHRLKMKATELNKTMSEVVREFIIKFLEDCNEEDTETGEMRRAA